MTITAFLLAFGTACLKTTKYIVVKLTPDRVDDWTLGWGSRYFSVPILAGAAYVFDTPPTLNSATLWSLAAIVLIATISTVMTMRALRQNDLSVASPLFASTPVFTVVTAWAIIGEIPTPIGLVGVLTIIAGVYALEIDKIKIGYVEPFRVLSSSTTLFLLVGIVALRALMQPILKVGVLYSSPIFFALAVQAGVSVVMTPIARPSVEQLTDRSIGYPILLGLTGAAGLIMTFLALQQALTAYVYSIQHVNIVLSIGAGWYIFDEPRPTSRLTGGLVVLAGLLILLIA